MSEIPPSTDPVATPDPIPMSDPAPMSDPSPYPRGMGAGPSQEEKTQASLAWFLSILTGFIAPLIFFLMATDKPYLKRHAAMALGLHIAVIIGYIISGILMMILIGFLTYALTFIFMIVVAIMGGMAANKGENYDVPLVGKMISNMFKV